LPSCRRTVLAVELGHSRSPPAQPAALASASLRAPSLAQSSFYGAAARAASSWWVSIMSLMPFAPYRNLTARCSGRCQDPSSRLARTTRPCTGIEMSPQLTAFFTSAPIRASSAAVNFFSAKAVGRKSPSSRFALSLKPNVAYLVLKERPSL